MIRFPSILLFFGLCAVPHCLQLEAECHPGDSACNPLRGALLLSFVPETACQLSARIAFQTNRDGNNNIYVMRSDGTEQTQLTTDVNSDQQPSFRPDGSAIVFIFRWFTRAPFAGQIFTIKTEIQI